MVKRSALLAIFLLSFFSSFAQTVWYDPFKEDYPVIQNQGWTDEIGRTYQRLPDRTEKIVRKAVWNLSENSAGIAIHFYTNAEKIEVRYGVTGNLAMDHMPTTGKSGIDLYAIDADGRWRFASGNYVFGDTITYTYGHLMQSKYHKKGFEYRLYLPLYNSVKWLEIGVPDTAELSFIPVLKEKPIVVYGTSIAQGGCASRPAMGWTNILSRKLDAPVINLAFSGNGSLEKEMVDLISELDVALIIYDCLPNMGNLTSEEVKKRTSYGVSAIRKRSDRPILIVDHIGYRNDETNGSTKAPSDRMNSASREVYDSLKQAGVKNLYHLHKDSIRFPADGSVDYIHPNDLGMQAYADAYEKSIRPILHMPIGKQSTTQPVSQRREPDSYEWKSRHDTLLAMRHQSPVKVIIGNSITHYWSGETGRENGLRSWKRYMEPLGFLNLGYGWDRIENVLWRLYHGELEGYTAEEIILMIGTNNLGTDSDKEIVEGLEFLLKQIELRQPEALIKVVGLLPRRGMEERIMTLNQLIAAMTESNHWKYFDVGKRLLKNGKIDESSFSDGLHPNEKGYSLIAPLLIQ